MDLYTFDEIAYGRWGDAGGYISGGDQQNTTPMNEYASYRHEHADYRFDVPPVMPIKLAYIAPGPPPYNAHQRTVPMVTPVSASTASTTTAGSTPRRTLTDDDRRRMCEYHESHPGAKQTEIGVIFGVERSTVSKILRRKEQLLKSNDGSQGPTKKAQGKIPDIERALANWVKNEQIKGKPLDHSKLQEQAQRFAVTVGNPESQLELTSPAWLEKFKQKYNILSAKGHSNFHESDEIHVVDSNTTSLSETPNSYTPVSSPSSELAPPPTSSPVPPLPRSENTSPVSSGSPTQDDARRALDLVWRYFQSQPAGFLEPDEYAVVSKLMVKLSSSISEGTAVLPGWIDKSLSSKRRRVEAVTIACYTRCSACSDGDGQGS